MLMCDELLWFVSIFDKDVLSHDSVSHSYRFETYHAGHQEFYHAYIIEI